MISGVYVVIGVSSIVVEVGYAMMSWSLSGNCLLVCPYIIIDIGHMVIIVCKKHVPYCGASNQTLQLPQ